MHVEGPPRAAHRYKLALVLWNGKVGGAETLNVSLAERLNRLGAEVTVVFVEQPGPLAKRFSGQGVPYRWLGFGRGRDVLRHPRQYAAVVACSGPDGALVVERGFMGAALRAGRYRGPIVAVEHGALLELPGLSRPQRLLRRVNYLSGAWADDAEVAVSDFMLDQTRRYPHARQIRRIYNGVDPSAHLPDTRAPAAGGSELVVGFAGRLIPGKGADHLIGGIAQANEQISTKLLIAGDGPERSRLESLARTLGVHSNVDFLGIIDDLPAFWRRCDAAAVPSTCIESFSMVTLEAMTCGKPIVATRSGAIPELIVDGVTGTLVTPGDVGSLARALVTYARRPDLRLAHGAAARERAVARFHIDDCAQAYLDLFGELATSRSVRAFR